MNTFLCTFLRTHQQPQHSFWRPDTRWDWTRDSAVRAFTHATTPHYHPNGGGLRGAGVPLPFENFGYSSVLRCNLVLFFCYFKSNLMFMIFFFFRFCQSDIFNLGGCRNQFSMGKEDAHVNTWHFFRYRTIVPLIERLRNTYCYVLFSESILKSTSNMYTKSIILLYVYFFAFSLSTNGRYRKEINFQT